MAQKKKSNMEYSTTFIEELYKTVAELTGTVAHLSATIVQLQETFAGMDTRLTNFENNRSGDAN